MIRHFSLSIKIATLLAGVMFFNCQPAQSQGLYTTPWFHLNLPNGWQMLDSNPQPPSFPGIRSGSNGIIEVSVQATDNTLEEISQETLTKLLSKSIIGQPVSRFMTTLNGYAAHEYSDFRQAHRFIDVMFSSGGINYAASFHGYVPAGERFPLTFGQILQTVNSFQLVQNQKPVILEQPKGQEIEAGEGLSLSVTVASTEEHITEWFLNGASTGVVGDQYLKTNASQSDSGNYYALITNEHGQVTTDTVPVTVNNKILPPTITKHPAPANVPNGGILVLTVGVVSDASYSTKWYRDGQLLGTTGNTLTVASFTQDQAGEYWAVVQNDFGEAVSNKATVTWYKRPEPPVIVKHPVSTQVLDGGTLNLNIDVSSEVVYTISWYREGQLLIADSDSLMISQFTEAHAGEYWAVVRSEFGELRSNTAVVNWVKTAVPPTILSHPASATVQGGEAFQLGVIAAGTEPLAYQWYKNSIPLSGQTAPVLSFSSAQANDSGQYVVRVSNEEGSVVSQSAQVLVIVNSPPTSIIFSPAAVGPKPQPGTVYGSISVVDPDSQDSHEITISGPGQEVFAIEGEELVAAVDLVPFNGQQVSFDLVAVDQDGGSISNGFAILIHYQMDPAPDGGNDSNDEPLWLSDGLVGYYPFNDFGKDESGNNNNGDIDYSAQPTSDRFGNINSAFMFRDFPVNGRMVVNNNAVRGFQVNGGVELTVTAWFTDESGSNDSFIAGNYESGYGKGYGFGVNALAGIYCFVAEDSTKLRFDSRAGIVGSGWHFATLVIKNQTVKVYLNGEKMLEEDISSENLSEVGKPFVVGSEIPRIGSAIGHNGAIDDVRLYRRALSSMEITQLYKWESPQTDPTPINQWISDSLIAHYPLNGHAMDMSGNGHDGVLVPNHESGILPRWTDDRHGKSSSAIWFDGNREHISVPHHDSLNLSTDNFTTSVWFRTEPRGGIHHLFGKDSAPDGPGNKWAVFYGGERPYFYIRTQDSEGDWLTDAKVPSVEDGKWHQIVHRKNGSTYSVFIDGRHVEAGDTQTESVPPALNTAPFKIGVGADGAGTMGMIDDLRLYSRALSDTEIWQLYDYEATTTVDPQPLPFTPVSDYQWINGSYTWEEARTDAELRGGHLVTITTQGENDLVASMVSANNDVWIGGSDIESDGSWKWVTGESFSFTNWGISEPNGRDREYYLHMWAGSGRAGKWNDSDETLKLGYILEIEPPISISPMNPRKSPGDTITLTAKLKNPDPEAFFQWFKDGQPIVGENRPQLELTALEISDQGDYTVSFVSGNRSGVSAAAKVVFNDSVPPLSGASLFIYQTPYFSELRFSTGHGKSYKLQTSENLLDWRDDTAVLPGNGASMKLMRVKDQPYQFWRVLELP